jgi:hypothetical protein
MKIKTTQWLVLIVGVCMEAHAGMVTVDFETVDVDGELQVLPGGVFQGMRFVESPTVGALHLIADGGCSVGCAASGGTSLLYEGLHNSGQPPLAITHPAGLSFRLLSLDAAEAFPTFGPPALVNAVGVGLVGTLAAGGSVTTFVDLDGVLDGPGGVADFQSVALDPAFADAILSRVSVWGLYASGTLPTPDENSDPNRKAGFSIDNLTFDVQGTHADYTVLNVPEPSTMALAMFVVALPGLAKRRRL